MNPILVSVVIPTYNPGRYLDAGIESLLAQTLEPDRFEIVVVDDGSTDGTPDRLDALAAKHPNLLVVHSEHSGWAGRPRNIGIERARGEFIQFMDQDDRMAPDALRLLTVMGRRNGSDIVLGKVASDFRGVALDLYRRNRDSCTIHDAPLISSLTPHKMFRRSFLLEHELRFPEGRRRLEDQLFVVRAYFAARVISIVADEICYFYLRRDDGGNAASNPDWDPKGYYANLREVLDVVVANTERGPQRAYLMRRFLRAQLVGPLAGVGFLKWTPEFRAKVFASSRGVIVDYVDPDIDGSLGAIMALRTKLIREDRLADLVTLAERTSELVALSRIETVGWVGGRLKVVFTTEIRHHDGTPLTFGRAGGRSFLDPALSQDMTETSVDVTDEIAGIRLQTMMRERTSGAEWATPMKVMRNWIPTRSEAEGTSGFRFVFHATCQADPGFLGGDGSLAPGEWVWQMRLDAFGLKLDRTLGADTSADLDLQMPIPQFIDPDLLVTPTLKAGAGIALQVARVPEPPHHPVYRRPIWSTWRIGETIVRVGYRAHGRLPHGIQRRSIALIRSLRRVIRSKP